MEKKITEKQKINLVHISYVKTGYDFLTGHFRLIEDFPRLSIGTFYLLLYVHMNRNSTLAEISTNTRIDANTASSRLNSLARMNLIEVKGAHGLKGYTTTSLAAGYLNH